MARAYPPTGSQPPSVELIVRQGPQPGQRFSLTKPTIIIGREVGNDVAINDPQISRRHASLTWDGRQFIIQDLGSANGTFVNGVRLTAPQVLQPGDVIGLGPTLLLGFQAMLPAHVPPRPAAPPAYAPPPPRPRARGRVALPLLVVLVGLCGLLAVAAALGYYFLWPRPEARPVVLINSPRHGQQVPVGQEITIQSIARDEGKVTRVELWVDGQLQEAQTSNIAGGASPMPLVTRWQPRDAGSHTVTVRAFNAAGARSHASLQVNASQPADRDKDNVADKMDRCPDQSGTPYTKGCPDRDNDGVADANDTCPDTSGLADNQGCPAPIANDRDGDGVLDSADGCPDQPGWLGAGGCPDADGDGVGDATDACPREEGWRERDGCPTPGDRDGDDIADAQDACPDEPGEPQHEGCPDDDGDEVAGERDACPSEHGLAGLAGCPDRDNDGVRDRDDQCPDQAGSATNGGCPVTGAGDRDRDGLADDVDHCPDEAGQPSHAGCPPPGMAEDRNGNGISDDEEATDDPVVRVFQLIPGGLVGIPPVPSPSGGTPPPGGGVPKILTPIEIEALEFRVFREYERVNCYVVIEHPPYPDIVIHAENLDPAGERSWDLGTHFGSENRLPTMAETEELVQIHIECDADDPAYRDLGSITEIHLFENEDRSSDWDGHVIGQRASGGSDGHSFWVSYRICLVSCSDVPFHPPEIGLYEYAGSAYLAWFYYGDPTSIRGFGIYRNGAIVARRLSDEPATGGSGWTPAGATRYTYAFPSSWRPACGTSDEFHVTSYGSGGRESPPSNTVTWVGQPCPRMVRVTFGQIDTGDLGSDWWKRAHGGVGPITGSFWASGTYVSTLEFDAAGGHTTGYFLPDHSTVFVADIFRVANAPGLCGGSSCNATSAPDVNFVTVELEQDDVLTIGGEITDVDRYNNETLLNTQITIQSDEISPDDVMMRFLQGGNMEVMVFVEELP